MAKPGFLCGILVAAALAGCQGHSARSSFYVLNPIEASARPTSLPGKIGVIGIGPVEIAKYLDRPQVVTRHGRNEIRISDSHLWAAPLKYDLARLITQNLAILLEGSETVSYPWKNAERVRYEVKISIQRLDVEKSSAVLWADWSIREIRSRVNSPVFRVKIEVPLSGRAYSEKVFAINETLNRFSAEIARGFMNFLGNH